MSHGCEHAGMSSYMRMMDIKLNHCCGHSHNSCGSIWAHGGFCGGTSFWSGAGAGLAYGLVNWAMSGLTNWIGGMGFGGGNWFGGMGWGNVGLGGGNWGFWGLNSVSFCLPASTDITPHPQPEWSAESAQQGYSILDDSTQSNPLSLEGVLNVTFLGREYRSNRNIKEVKIERKGLGD